MDIKELWEKYYNALKQQDWSKALGALSTIKQKKERDSQVYLKMGDLLQRMGDTVGAIEAYHKSAVYLVKEGFIQKAAAIFKIILRLDPNNNEATVKLQRVIEVASSSKGAFPQYTSAPVMELPPLPDTMTTDKEAEHKEVPLYNEIPAPEKIADTEKAEVPSYGDITLPGSETEGAEVPEKERELGPGYGEVTLDENEASDNYTGLFTSEKDEPAFKGYEDFDDLLTEAAKELPDIEKKTSLSSDLPAFLVSIGGEQGAGFTERALKNIYKSGERIVKEGDTGDSLFLIKDGRAKVVAHIIGKEFVLAELGNGDIFGEVTFLTGRPRTASVIADGEVEVLEFKRQLLEEVISKYPEVLECLNDLYDTRVSSTLKKVVGE
ncbi:MAG: hypothetical protein A2X59_08305 [Nitrospirae bacterium GWC2_42_7]|nr:MAG: hypothetical protein A2X59_08305 [Nitrospirae bacterium GWC2_42_7]